MPYTVPLKAKPTAIPSPSGPIVDKNGLPTPEFYTWVIQVTDWIKPIDAAVRQVEP